METTPLSKQLTSVTTRYFSSISETLKTLEDISTQLLLESQGLVNPQQQTLFEKNMDLESLQALLETAQLSQDLLEAATKLQQDSRLALVSYLRIIEDSSSLKSLENANKTLSVNLQTFVHQTKSESPELVEQSHCQPSLECLHCPTPKQPTEQLSRLLVIQTVSQLLQNLSEQQKTSPDMTQLQSYQTEDNLKLTHSGNQKNQCLQQLIRLVCVGSGAERQTKS